MRWIPKGMTVEYLRKATGTMRAVATPARPVVEADAGYELQVEVEVRPRGRGGLPRPHRDVGIAAPLRRGYVPDGGAGSRPAHPYGRPATSPAATAASAATACTQTLRRPTVAFPYTPAPPPQPRKKSAKSTTDTSHAHPRPTARTPLY